MQARLRALVALTLLALGMSLALVPSTAHAAPAKPKVGECHDLTTRQAWAASDSRKPVPCSSRHTLKTFAVPVSPTSFVGLSEDEASEIGFRLCDGPLRRALGGTETKLAQTLYSEFMFLPTSAQRAAGARWVRCDIGIVAATGLRRLPRLSHPVLKGQLSDRERLCLTKRDASVTCDQPHAYRSQGAYVSASVAHPGADAVLQEAGRRCPRTSSYAQWPDEQRWSASNRIVVCFQKTSR